MVRARTRREPPEPGWAEVRLTLTAEELEELEAKHKMIDIGLARYYGHPVKHPEGHDALDGQPSEDTH